MVNIILSKNILCDGGRMLVKLTYFRCYEVALQRCCCAHGVGLLIKTLSLLLRLQAEEANARQALQMEEQVSFVWFSF